MTQIWYEIQYSLKDADDWYSSNETTDTLESIRRRLKRADNNHPDYKYRVVKRTLTEEVVSLTEVL